MIGGEKMLEILKLIQMGEQRSVEYTSSNEDFICPACKQKTPCYASFVTLRAGYGSIYDGEKAMVRICGDCMDRLFEQLEIE